MKTLKILFALILVVCMTSCYEEYVADYEHSSTGFAIEKPLRTVIADRDMEIFVGASIGGKRKVDMSDWVTFEVMSDYVVPATYELLPDNYYTFSDPNTMRVRKSNLPVADVGIKFTDAFYNDAKALSKHYLLPLRITDSSLDSIYRAETIVAIKFISTFHGTYYIKGKLEELDASDNVVDTKTYNNKDLIKNYTCDLQTTARNILNKPQVSMTNPTVISERIQLTFNIDNNKDKIYNVTIQQGTGGGSITDGSGTYYGNKEQPEIQLNYSFVKGGKNYRVEETLVLRQDPLYDFRVESW